MWKRILSFFRSASAEVERPFDFEAIKLEVEAVLKLDFTSDAAREANGEQVLNVLRHLDAEVENVCQQANGYPAKAIFAFVWLNGAGYGNLACALTNHFRNAGWLDREQNASALWAKAVLAVCSHYHHMVGPAMLANADCHDRLGNPERASQMYGSVVKDFAFLIDDWLNEEVSPQDDDRVALESLQTATERLLTRGVRKLDGIDLAALQANVSNVLSRPSHSGGDAGIESTR